MTTPGYKPKNTVLGMVLSGIFALFIVSTVTGVGLWIDFDNKESFEVIVYTGKSLTTYHSQGRVQDHGESWMFTEKDTGRIIHVPKAFTTVISMSRYEQQE